MLTTILDVLSRYLPLLLLPVMAFATEKLQHRRIAALTGQLYNLTECSLSQKFDLWVDQIYLPLIAIYLRLACHEC